MIQKRDNKMRLSPHKEGAEKMAKDTRYLSFIHNSWHFDYPIPKRLRKWFKIKRIRHSLNTSNVDQAINLRDVYLRPIISVQTAEGIIKQIHCYLEIAEKDLEQNIGNLKSFMNRKKEMEVVNLKGICDYFISHYQKKNPSPASISKYNSAISAVCSLIDASTPVESITKKDVLGLRDVLLSAPVRWKKTGKMIAEEGEQTLNSNTVKATIGMLKNIFDKAIKDEIVNLTENPANNIDISETKPKSKRPPEGNEVELLCKMPMPRSSHFNEEAWKMLPILARYTGCRIGELALLNASDVIVRNNVKVLKITAYGENKKLKTESSERVVPVSEKLNPFLVKLLKNHPAGRFFSKCGDLQGRDENIKRGHYFDKAYNIAAKKISKDLSFHCWRVYANTQMADAGIDILDREAVLGHKSDRIQRVYTADNLQRLKKAVDKIS